MRLQSQKNIVSLLHIVSPLKIKEGETMAKSNQGKITALYEGFPEMMSCKVNLTAF